MAADVKVGSIFAEIRAKLDNYDKDLKDARKMTEKEMAGLQKSIDKLSFDKAGSSMMDFAKKAAMAFAAFKIVDMVKDATMAAARYETLGVVLDRLSANTKYSTSEIKAFEDQLQKTGIAALEARQVLTMMMQSNLDLGKSADLARVAQDAAVIANLNSSETLQRMTHAIQANSVEIMRTIGMNVSFEGATRKLAQSLGTTVEKLTEAQKMQARLNATIEGGAQIAGAYEASMSTAAKQIKSFERYVSNFQVEFGKAFNPALTAIVFGASEALKSLTEAVKDPKFQADMTKFANEFSTQLVNGMKWLVDNREQVGGYFKGIATGLETIARVFNMLPMEAWGAILGFAITRSPYGAVIGAGVAGIERLVAENRTLLQYMEDQVAEQEKIVVIMEQGHQSGLDFFKIRDKANKDDLEYQKAKLMDLKDALGIQKQLAQAGPPAKERSWEVSESRYSRKYAADMKGKEVAPITKELQAQLDAFQKAYNKSVMTAYDFEVATLDAQKKEYEKFVTDKIALSKWYVSEKQKIDQKEAWDQITIFEDAKEEFEKAKAKPSRLEQYEIDQAKPNDWEAEYQKVAREHRDALAEEEKKSMEGMVQLTERTASAMQDNFSTLFFDAMTGKLKTFQDYYKAVFDSIARMASDLAAQMATEAIFGNLSKTGGGGGGGGLLGTIMGMIGGGTNSSPQGNPYGAGTGDWAAVAHRGGIIGEAMPGRRVPSWLFDGAPRLHGGLKSNEKPVIMEKGEEVIAKKDVGKQTEQPQVHMHFYPNSQGQYDRESVSEAQARLYSSISRANQRNR